MDLKVLEYRGYDSAGITLLINDELKTIKQKGKVSELDSLINQEEINCNIGIAHTRWATHGEPNNLNAHPHFDNSRKISIVHNGIIENYSVLKHQLLEKGFFFETQTDTEVLAVLISAFYEQVKDLEKAVRMALKKVVGTFRYCRYINPMSRIKLSQPDVVVLWF